MNWDAKIHTDDPERSFIILIMDEPTEGSARKVAREWLAANFPELTLRDLEVRESEIK